MKSQHSQVLDLGILEKSIFPVTTFIPVPQEFKANSRWTSEGLL